MISLGNNPRANEYAALYDQTLKNKNDATNKKTIKAWNFVSKLFADFAKTGYVFKKC